MLLMRRAGIRSYATHVEIDKSGRSLQNKSAQLGSGAAEQTTVVWDE